MKASIVLLGARRLALTTKSGHGYYKGTRTGRTGNHTKHGGFIVDYNLVRTYPPPKPTTLMPFVTREMSPMRAKRESGVTRITGRIYLDASDL